MRNLFPTRKMRLEAKEMLRQANELLARGRARNKKRESND